MSVGQSTTKCSLDFVTSISTQAYAKVSTVPGKNNTNLHRLRGETRLPTVLGVCSRSSEWVFLALYTATLGGQSLLFFDSKAKCKVILLPLRQPPLVVLVLGSVMSQKRQNKAGFNAIIRLLTGSVDCLCLSVTQQPRK